MLRPEGTVGRWEEGMGVIQSQDRQMPRTRRALEVALQKEVRAQRKVAKPAGKMIQSVRTVTTQI